MSNMDDSSTPPLLHAAEQGDAELVEELLNGGAQVNCVDQLGWTPLHEAAMSNKEPSLCALLLRHRASVTAVNKYGETPLHMAAANESSAAIEICRLLLELGADPEATDVDCRTAMDIAEDRGGLRPQSQQEALLTLLRMSPERMRARAEGRARGARAATDRCGLLGLLVLLLGPPLARMAGEGSGEADGLSTLAGVAVTLVLLGLAWSRMGLEVVHDPARMAAPLDAEQVQDAGPDAHAGRTNDTVGEEASSMNEADVLR